MAEQENVVLCASALTFSNIAYILRKWDHSVVMNLFNNLRCVLEVLPVDDGIIEEAIHSNFTDFEDAVQNYCAEKGNVDIIVTRNASDFKSSQIRIASPDEI